MHERPKPTTRSKDQRPEKVNKDQAGSPPKQTRLLLLKNAVVEISNSVVDLTADRRS